MSTLEALAYSRKTRRVHRDIPWPAARQPHTILQTITAIVHRIRQRQKARRELASLDGHMLRDIGISRELVDYELRQPVWRPLRDWRDLRHGRGGIS
jgi:uncharacterized protein YjiS (DUF1127 family)